MKIIQLHGILGEKFQEEYRLDVQSVGEAVHAISCQIPAFKKFMIEAEANGIVFAVFTDDVNINEKETFNATPAEIIHIVPEIMGAGGKTFGFLQVITGAVLVGLSFTPFGAPFAPALLGAGAGMMVGGVASMLMPTPDLQNQDEDGNRANANLGGAITTTAIGNPVPYLGGERKIGGFFISGGIYSEDKQ